MNSFVTSYHYSVAYTSHVVTLTDAMTPFSRNYS